MKSKLNPIYLIVGLFLFKVGVIDNFRNMGHHQNDRIIASEAPSNNLKPIR
ncbi:MAG: hypothetical protein Q7U04_06875 [Bacteriovorax sp.]|nr:hypothetical protein [Bacteriovorax sp.]